MKRLLVLVLFGLLIFGCTGGPATKSAPGTPAAAASASATPLPTTDVEAAAAGAIVQAQGQVPLSNGFLADLAGQTQSAPADYEMTTEGSASVNLGLSPLSQLYFDDAQFTLAFKQVAGSPLYRRIIRVGSNRMDLSWTALDSAGKQTAQINATLARRGTSIICVSQTGAPQCVTPKREQVESLLGSLRNNALESGIQTLFPDVSLKALLTVKAADGKASFGGRSCKPYALGLTADGLAKLKSLGAGVFSDVSGSMCLDDQYHFPLTVSLVGKAVSATENVTNFTEIQPSIAPLPSAAATASVMPTASATPVAELKQCTFEFDLTANVLKASFAYPKDIVPAADATPYPSAQAVDCRNVTRTVEYEKKSVTLPDDAKQIHSVIYSKTSEAGPMVYAGYRIIPFDVQPGTTTVDFSGMGDSIDQSSTYGGCRIPQTAQYKVLGWYYAAQCTTPPEACEATGFKTPVQCDVPQWAGQGSATASAVPSQTPTVSASPTPSVFPSATATPTPKPTIVPTDTALIVSDGSVRTDNLTSQRIVSLNAEESAARALLARYAGLNVTLLPQSEATGDTLGLFKNIVATDYYPNSPFNAEAVGKLAAAGKKIVLLRDAIGFGNDGNDLGEQTNFDLTITKNEAFLSNYDTWQNEDYYPNIHVQDGGKSYQNRGMLTNIATSDHCCYRVSTFYANNSAGGRIAAWGYDPAQLSNEGKVMADQVFRWALGLGTSDAVPSGSAALIVQDYGFDGKSQPSLTASESALKALLEAEGQTVYLVPQSRRFTEDFSGASIVAAASFPGLRLTNLYDGLTTKKPGLFMSDAVLDFSQFSNVASNPLVAITSDKGAANGQAYLAHYDASADHNGYLALNIQANNAKGYCRNNLGGWTQISSVPANQGCGYGGTMFSREADGVRSVLIGHDPSALNDEGKLLFDEAFRWALKDDRKAVSVPAGNVGLLINDFTNAAALTANETAFQNHLQAIGFKVTAVPQADRFKTDFTQAAFLAAIEDGYWNKYSFSSTLGALGAYAPRAVFVGPAIGLATDGRQAAEDTRNPAGGHPWESMYLDFGYDGKLGHDLITVIGPQSSGVYTKSAYHFGGAWKGAAQQWTCCSAYTVWMANPSAHASGLLFGYTFTQLNAAGLNYLDTQLKAVAARR